MHPKDPNLVYAAVLGNVFGESDQRGVYRYEAGETYDYLATGAIGTDAIRVALIDKPATVSPVGDVAILDSSVDDRFDDDRRDLEAVEHPEELVEQLALVGPARDRRGDVLAEEREEVVEVTADGLVGTDEVEQAGLTLPSPALLAERMWDPEKLEAHALDWQVYERFAALASRAASAPLA